MAAGKETKAIDEVTVKTPGALIVAFRQNAGNKTAVGMGSLLPEHYITKQMFVDNVPLTQPDPIIYHLPAASKTPVIIDFSASTIKLGTDAAISIGYDLSNYQGRGTSIDFEAILGVDTTSPKESAPWITNKKWSGSGTYTTLIAATLQPDTDTGVSGGLTLDNLNIIIKP